MTNYIFKNTQNVHGIPSYNIDLRMGSYVHQVWRKIASHSIEK